MTVTVTHTKVSAIPDGADTTVVRPSDWNATHTLVGLGTAAELDAGVANGVATLDASGKVPLSQLTGVVTSVTGTAPVASSGGATPAISMAAASTSVDGYLAATDFTTFNNKQPAGSYLTAVTSDAPLTGSGTSASHLSIPAATASVNGYLTSADWTTFNGKGSGTVTSVSGTAPVVSTGGATPVISMAAATASVNGYLTSADWTTFNSKGSGTVTSVSATSPITSSGGATPTIAIPAATASVNGYLTSADWTSFNNKGSGSVTSVAATVPSFLSITGTPITSSGTLAISYSGTALPIANGGTGLTALGTGVQTAIGVNIGTAGAFVVNGGALGTPSSGTVTNLTGTASININGTVGATTANTGAFTTLSATGITTVAAGSAALPAIVSTTGTADTGLWFPAADTIAASTGGTERLRINSSGNVGIGTSSPDTLLNIQGTNPSFLIQSSSETGDGFVKFQTANGTQRGFIQTAMTANVMLFGGGTTEAMRLDTSNNLLVGTTSAAGVGLTIGNQAGNSGVPYLQFNKSLSGNVTVQYFYYNGSGVGTINISDTATSYNTSSDYRLKENVAPMQNALATVAALKPVTYTWKADGSEGQGFIAHELQDVVPDCVTGEKDAVQTVDDLDDDGKKIGIKEVPKYQGIDTSFLVATLTAAIQELKAIIDTQADRIAALEGKA